MKTENVYFDVFPKVVRSDTSTTITIKERYGQFRLNDSQDYEIRHYPMNRYSKGNGCHDQDVQYVKARNGVIRFEQYFAGEQEHIIELIEKGNESWEKKTHFRIYSLEADLFDRRPFKGDLHMHTLYSDGKETPGFLAAACRKTGLNFIAVTDHGQYIPSIEAQKAFENIPLDMLICRGEEIHPENNPVHMVNFGGSISVNQLMQDNTEAYRREVEEIKSSLEDIEDADARYQCASCIWAFNKIREGGGLGVFCHPYWEVEDGNYISESVISYMLEKQPYDALELIGGYYKTEAYSNTLQVARYHEERAKGRKIPIVGVSDSHGSVNSELFGWYYTVVFSPSLGQKEITGSIKDMYSVAVEALPGESARAHGPFRLVRYAMFLIREVFPEHDQLCIEEGTHMLKYLSGDKAALERLAGIKGQTFELYNKLWA